MPSEKMQSLQEILLVRDQFAEGDLELLVHIKGRDACRVVLSHQMLMYEDEECQVLTIKDVSTM